MELAERVVLVTGATRGIGRAAAEALAAAGAQVVLTGRNEKDGADAVDGIKKNGGGAIFVPQDANRPDGWARVLKETDSAFGRLDGFVANAGISFSKTASEMSLEEFRSLCSINLSAVFFGLQHAVTAIRKSGRGGSVVLMSSVVGKIGAPGYTHYAAAKGGVRLMAKAAALELGAENIRVNSLHPGFVRSDMTSAFPEPYMASLTPLNRIGEPREIADAIVYLVSDRSRFVTGAEIVVDGGLSVR